MRPQKPYLTGVWVLAVITIFSILLFGFLANSFSIKLPDLAADDPFLLLYLSILLSAIEGFIYWRVRHSIQKKTWVHLHVWSFFVASVIIPIIGISIVFFINISLNTLRFYVTIGEILMYFSWGLLAMGHIFFIATIVRYFTRKKIIENNNESAGLLDEFIT